MVVCNHTVGGIDGPDAVVIKGSACPRRTGTTCSIRGTFESPSSKPSWLPATRSWAAYEPKLAELEAVIAKLIAQRKS